MAKIPSFGFSAFLKIICTNDKPQKRAIRERHKPSNGGYDFHKNLRRRIQWLSSGSHSPAQVIASLSDIAKAPERASTYAGLKKFIDWLSRHKAKTSFCDEICFKSPNGLFQVKFAPDFLTEIEGRMTAVHVWNTQETLSRNLVIALLTTVALNWENTSERPDDFAVFSLQDGQLYKWSEHTREHKKMGHSLMLHIEKLCKNARMELGLPMIGDEKQPPQPPTP